MHSHHYRTPEHLPGAVVLVVGGGNSGVQIAQELARAGRQVHLAARTRPRHLPQRVLGRDLFWWLHTTGVLGAPATSRLGRRLRAADPVIGTPRSRLVRAGVRFHPAVVAAAGDTVTFADGASLVPEAVLWATGYRHDDRWVRIPGAVDEHGKLITATGRTPAPGLFTLGRSWQRDRSSALLGFVGADARRLVAELTT
ncbi:NAD(P)-binding domain-containing protein [Kocuria rhizophila]|uniref:NAD(P)-binding domain-containing protein n=1 Tax=Kocuria rhizophila TaxID=72000 RepID=UPI00356B7586